MKKVLWPIVLGMLMICQIIAAQNSPETKEKDKKAIRKIVEN
jgi:hypothetical protein